jgi:predicted lactoylglutathione lyase
MAKSQALFKSLGCAFNPTCSHGFEDLDGRIWELIHMSGMPPKE